MSGPMPSGELVTVMVTGRNGLPDRNGDIFPLLPFSFVLPKEEWALLNHAENPILSVGVTSDRR